MMVREKNRLLGFASMALFSVLIFAFILFSSVSTAVIEKDTYELGESVKITLDDISEYQLKIKTPSTTYLKQGGNDVVLFRPQELGTYTLILDFEGEESVFEFSVVAELDETIVVEDSFDEGDSAEKNVSEITKDDVVSDDEVESADDELVIEQGEQIIVDSLVSHRRVEEFDGVQKKVSLKLPPGTRDISVFAIKGDDEMPIAFEVKERSAFASALTNLLGDDSEKEQTIILEDVSGTIAIDYVAPGPTKTEWRISSREKEIVVSSSEGQSYENILVYTSVSEMIPLGAEDAISVYWVEEGKEIEFRPFDHTGDGIIDWIEWDMDTSEATFSVSIDILNVQSYPVTGGMWEVFFTTVGTADLHIRAVDGTGWSDTHDEFDLRFLNITCGGDTLEYEWFEGGVFIEDYSCEDVGVETSRVITNGKHTIAFTFGEQTVYAYNDAAPYETGIANYSGTGWLQVNTSRTYTIPVVVAMAREGFEINANQEVITAAITNKTSNSFLVRLRNESDPVAGNISYIVVENGTHVLENGMVLQAGIFEPVTNYDANSESASSWYAVTFHESYSSTPSVIASPNNGSANDWMAVRYDGGTESTTGITLSLEIDNLYGGAPVAASPSNSIGWIALNRTNAASMEGGFESAVDEDPDAGDWRTLVFSNTYNNTLFFALGEQDGGSDPTKIGINNLNDTGVEIRQTEERTDGEQVHATEDVMWIAIEAGIGNTPPSEPTNVTCDHLDNCNVEIDVNITFNGTGSVDPQNDVITYAIEIALPNTTTSGDQESGTITVIGLEGTVIGEAGAVNTSNYNWQIVPFVNTYDSAPVVLATPASQNGAAADDDSYIIPSISSINQTAFNVTLCQDNGATTCDTTVNEEEIHYFVFDTTAANQYSWMAVGTQTVTTAGADTSLSYGKTFTNVPLLWLQSQTNNQGNNIAAVAWAEDISTRGTASGPVIGCVHQAGAGGSEDACTSGQPSETFGFLAVDNSSVNISGWQSGGADISNSAWTSGGFSPAYTLPRAMVTENDDDGGQDPEYAWARNVGPNSLDFRYCEQDGADDCNSHTSEVVYWFAVENGTIVVPNPDIENNKSFTTYSDVFAYDWKTIDELNVTVSVTSYSNAGSTEQGNNDADLSLELYNGTDFIHVGNFSVTGTGDFTITVDNSEIVAAWQNATNTDLRIQGIDIDFFNTTDFDTIEWNGVDVTFDGRMWNELGNHTETDGGLVWDTRFVAEQEGIDVRARAIDINGSATFSEWFVKNGYINISHDFPLVSFVSPHTPINGSALSQDFLEVNVSITENYPLNVTYELFNATGLVNRSVFASNILFINFTSLPDGTYFYNVSVLDESLQFNVTETRTLYLDSTTPSVVIDHPQNISYVVENLDVNFTVLDENLDSCWYTIDGGTTNVTLASCANGSFTSPQGSVMLQVYANDSAGNVNNTEAVTYFVDSINPLIEFVAPTPLNESSRGDMSIFINVSITEANFDNVTFTLANATDLINVTTYTTLQTFINWTNLSNQFVNYTYNVSVTDLLGNTNITETRLLTLTPGDIAPPDIFITSPPSEGYFFNSSSVDFILSLSETGDTVAYSLDYGATNITMNTSDDINYNATNSPMSDGDYEVTFYANDTIGNLGDRARNFTVDTTVPLIDYGIGTEIGGANVSRDFIYVNVSVTETNERNITFRLFDSGHALLNASAFTTPQRTINWTGFVDGDYRYNVSVYDDALFENTTITRTIRLDTTLPNATLLSPDNATYVNNRTQNLTVNATDNLGLHNVTLFVYNVSDDLINETNVVELGTEARIGVLYLFPDDGNFTWGYRATDSAGNSFSSENYTLFMDATAPLINFTIGTPDNGTELEQGSVFANVTLTEINFVNITYEISNETSLVNRTTFTTPILSINWTNLPSANLTYFYNVSSTDISGTVNSTETRTITLIDTQLPELTIVNPLNTTYSRNTSIPIDYIAVDVNLGSCWYTLDGGATNITLNNCGNTTIDVADEQQYTLTLYANDTLGLVNSSSVTFFANSSFIQTTTWFTQRGSLSVDGTGTVDLSQEVDDLKSFVIHTQRSSDSGPDSLFVMNDFVNSTRLQFDNYAAGAGATVIWETITGPDLSVQRNQFSFSTTDVDVNVTLTSQVNVSASFIIVTTRLNSGTSTENQRGKWTGRFINSTVISFNRGVSGDSGDLSWQVVEWTGAHVRNGSFSLSATEGTQDFGTTAELNNSFLIFSSTTTSGTALDFNNIGGFFVDSDTIGFYRDDADAGSMFAEFFVVESPLLDVQHDDFTLTGATSPTNTPLIDTLINQSRSFHRATWDSTGSGNTHANAIVTTELTSATNLQTVTGTTATNVRNVSWQAMELIERDSPNVNLLAPTEGFNFSTFTIAPFNYSVNDESDIVNCSLFGNWTASFHRNQTDASITKDSVQDFSSIDVEGDGYYIWNVECIDVYNNIGTNSTNFTFAAFLFPDIPLLLNATQTSNDGLGNITLFWNATGHAVQYRVYTNTSLNGNFTLIGETTALNFTDPAFSGNERKFYRVDAVNPSGQNASEDYFSGHLYHLRHNENTRNWIGLPTNATYLETANQTLFEITNATAFTRWNATLQQRVTCNLFSCPSFPSCTDTNCNFNTDPGLGFEVNVNSTAPSIVNWSVVGILYRPLNLSLVKNATDFGKNWIALYANTTLLGASDILSNISDADATSIWNESTQTSSGLIINPFGDGYLGHNFSFLIETGYEVSVNESLNWTQR